MILCVDEYDKLYNICASFWSNILIVLVHWLDKSDQWEKKIVNHLDNALNTKEIAETYCISNLIPSEKDIHLQEHPQSLKMVGIVDSVKYSFLTSSTEQNPAFK